MILVKQKSDILGAAVSSLCMIHCSVTPILFITLSNTTNYHTTTPAWWPLIDYIFLIISFFAIYKSAQTTTINWMKPSLWISWAALFIVIINEKIEWLSLMNGINYFPTFTLIILHLYNKKYCQCNKNECCLNER